MFKTYLVEYDETNTPQIKESREFPLGNYEWGYEICENVCIQEEMEECLDCEIASYDIIGVETTLHRI